MDGKISGLKASVSRKLEKISGGSGLWPTAIALGALVAVSSLYPYFATAGPAHQLGNSAAIWLATAFAIGAAAGRPRRAAAAGTVMMCGTLATFYVCVQLLYPNSGVLANLTYLVFWGVPAVPGAALLAACGSLWRHNTFLPRGISVAALAGAFIGEAMFLVIDRRSSSTELDALAEAIVALVLIFLLPRSKRQVALGVLALALVGGLYYGLYYLQYNVAPNLV
jgi:hypothetical protein